MSDVVRLADYRPATQEDVRAYHRTAERIREMHVVIAVLTARISAIEAGKPVEHLGVELARAFTGLPAAQLVAVIRAAIEDLHEVCAATGLDPTPFRCGEEVEEHAIRECDRLALAAGATPLTRSYPQ